MGHPASTRTRITPTSTADHFAFGHDMMSCMEANTLSLVLDCRDPQALAKFWAPALGYVDVGRVENYTMLVPDGVSGPHLLLQLVAEDKAGKNRMHLDIHTP